MDIIWNPAENIAISPSADASVCVRGLFCISKEVDLLQYPQKVRRWVMRNPLPGRLFLKNLSGVFPMVRKMQDEM